jgi:urocanate hydratase
MNEAPKLRGDPVPSSAPLTLDTVQVMQAESSTKNYTPIRAPRGNTRTAKGWIQEAAKRMLMNNLDPAVAEKPEELIVYGGRGKAARNWDCYHKIIETLDRLENNQTLLVQSGKAVGVVETHRLAPRVLIANSNLVPRWANWEEFDKLDAAGLMMYGQMTAGSWIYIGTQGILQGTYETFRGAAKRHFNDTLAGTITVTAGLGGMGGAQPLAVKLAGGVSICVEVDPQRIQRRLETRYLDKATDSLDEAIRLALNAKKARQALSIGLMGNAAELLPKMVQLGFIPDLVTDQTSSHDPMWGYLPIARSDEDLNTLRSQDAAQYTARVQASIAVHVEAILEMQRRGAIAFDYGNNLRTQAKLAGVGNAFGYPGFVPAFIRDSFCEGRGPFRWVALSGDPADIAKTDEVSRGCPLAGVARFCIERNCLSRAASAHLLAGISRPRPRRVTLQPDGARWPPLCADCDRPGPPRCGFRRQSISRD